MIIRPIFAIACAIHILTAHAHAQVEKEVLVGVNYFAGWWKELPNKWHGQGWRVGQPDWRPELDRLQHSVGADVLFSR